VVAVRHVEAGTAIEQADITVRDVPASLVPDGATRRSPVGDVAAVDLHAGEVLVGSRLAGGRSALAALLPAGARGIAVPNDGHLPLEPGDRVDVLATFDSTAGADGPPTFPVARRASVLRAGRSVAMLAVTSQEAARVAYALATARITLALAG
jgi:pilus assembly protein CpaB